MRRRRSAPTVLSTLSADARAPLLTLPSTKSSSSGRAIEKSAPVIGSILFMLTLTVTSSSLMPEALPMWSSLTEKGTAWMRMNCRRPTPSLSGVRRPSMPALRTVGL